MRALRRLQVETIQLEAQFNKEVALLEDKYAERHKQLYDRVSELQNCHLKQSKTPCHEMECSVINNIDLIHNYQAHSTQDSIYCVILNILLFSRLSIKNEISLSLSGYLLFLQIEQMEARIESD